MGKEVYRSTTKEKLVINKEDGFEFLMEMLRDDNELLWEFKKSFKEQINEMTEWYFSDGQWIEEEVEEVQDDDFTPGEEVDLHAWVLRNQIDPNMLR